MNHIVPGLGRVELAGNGLLLPDRRLLLAGKFVGKHVRGGKIIEEFEDPNIVVNEGLNHILDVYFNAATQVTTWYLAPFEGNYTPLATDTAAVITANATETTAYTQSTRQAFTTVSAASQSVTNAAAVATFTFNAGKTIYGAFLASASAKSATTGKLFSAAQFSSSKVVVSTDQILLTYTFTASSV